MHEHSSEWINGCVGQRKLGPPILLDEVDTRTPKADLYPDTSLDPDTSVLPGYVSTFFRKFSIFEKICL